MQNFEFTTDRNYGAPQRIVCTILNTIEDEFGATHTVRFDDTARRISGIVSVFAFGSLSERGARDQVMAAYDAGQYEQV